MEDVSREDRLDVVERQIDVDELERGREGRHSAVLVYPDRDLGLDRRGRPAGDRNGLAGSEDTVASQVSRNRSGDAKPPLDSRDIDPDLPADRLGAGLELGRAPRQQRLHARLDAHRRDRRGAVK